VLFGGVVLLSVSVFLLQRNKFTQPVSIGDSMTERAGRDHLNVCRVTYKLKSPRSISPYFIQGSQRPCQQESTDWAARSPNILLLLDKIA
jgi:hypothetical protein